MCTPPFWFGRELGAPFRLRVPRGARAWDAARAPSLGIGNSRATLRVTIRLPWVLGPSVTLRTIGSCGGFPQTLKRVNHSLVAVSRAREAARIRKVTQPGDATSGPPQERSALYVSPSVRGVLCVPGRDHLDRSDHASGTGRLRCISHAQASVRISLAGRDGDQAAEVGRPVGRHHIALDAQLGRRCCCGHRL
jgi:hypothetical protein